MRCVCIHIYASMFISIYLSIYIERERDEGRARRVVKRNIQYISPDSETRSGFNCFLEPAVLSACRKFSGGFFQRF